MTAVDTTPTSSDTPEQEQELGILEDPAGLLEGALPWAISVVFHLMIFLLMFLMVWVVQTTASDEALPVAEASLADLMDNHLQSGSDDPDLELTQSTVPVEAEDFAAHDLNLLNEVADQAHSDLSIIGIGAGASGGELADYGLTVGGLGEGPSFFGLGRGEKQARRICYVIDRSGSMVDELDFVKEEVYRSIDRLHRIQQFHIIFFSGGPPIEAQLRSERSGDRFVHAIKEYKKAAFEFLVNIEAGGSTDPIQAIKSAIDQKADLIYFLTDGEFSPELIEKLRVWNKNEKVRIYTIAFIRRTGEDLLRQIAKENGGDYRFVSEDELY